MISRYLKKGAFSAANLLGADALFRRVNKEKLLVVMYHGVSASAPSPIWTQLPVAVFRRQLEFLRRNYRVLALSEVVDAVRGNRSLPERAALITFDDGLRNNLTVAFPVLEELAIPATVFLTVDAIGTREILWVDELYLLLCEAAACGVAPEVFEGAATRHLRAGRIWESYQVLVEALKRSGSAPRNEAMNRLRNLLPAGLCDRSHDFALLDWDEVRALQRSKLVEFGVHTATHRILSELQPHEWERELVAPKKTLEQELGVEAATFCFPNGRPLLDFRSEHLEFLRNAGYACAFTTENALFDLRGGDPLSIGRIPAGNDSTSEADYFRLNTSGALGFLKTALKRKAPLTGGAGVGPYWKRETHG